MIDKDFFKNKDNVLAIIGIIFFVVLAIIARNNNSSMSSNEQDDSVNNVVEKENQQEESEEDINYKFTYTVNNNGNISVIEGKRYNNKEKFSIIENGSKQEYARLDTSYMKLFNDNYEILKEDINDYFKYIDINSVKEILEYSNYEEDEEDDIENYSIDITDLIDRYNFELDYNGFDDFDDDSVILTRRNNNIVSIEMDYSNYFTYVNNSTYTFKVTMNFSSYGKVEDFDI